MRLVRRTGFTSVWILVDQSMQTFCTGIVRGPDPSYHIEPLKADWISNFGPITWLDSGHEYDFNSVMHYSGYACSNSTNGPTITFKDTDIPVLPNNTDTLSEQGKLLIKDGLNRDLNPGPLAPKARIIPLDHWALFKIASEVVMNWFISNFERYRTN